MRIFSTTALITTLSFALPAHAELTADDIWNAWSTGALSGAMESATTTRSGNTLTISGITLEIAEDDNEPLVFTFGDINLIERGGEVEIAIDAAYPITVQASDNGEDVTVSLLVRSQGNSIIASGDPDATIYDFSALEWRVDMDDVTGSHIDGDIPIAGAFVASNLAGSYNVDRMDDITRVASAFTIDEILFDFLFEEPGEGRAEILISLDALSSNSTTNIPFGIDVFDPQAMQNPDYTAVGSLSYASGSIAVDVNEDGAQTRVDASWGGGSSDLIFGDGHMAYTTVGGPMQAEVSNPFLPFPVSFSL